ncbi:hypothetical protein IEN52_10305 [Stenotrophomonas rhizophila]|nr:hypothetical protein [Stenotrophomonas rhizophila]MCC7663925.1 hypothetical protein [Stenotrophomonas rhizophila]
MSHRRAGWRGSLLVLLALASLPAAAQSMTCGSFAEADGGSVLRLEGPDRAVEQQPELPPAPYRVQRAGNQLTLADLDSGRVRTLAVLDGGRRLSDADTGASYRLQHPARCRPAVAVAAGSCQADPARCLQTLASADTDRLRQWCHEGVPAACKRLLENYRDQARSAGRPDPAIAATDLAEPEACKQESGRFDEAACRAAARQVLDKAMASFMAGALGPATAAPLAPAQLDDLVALCRAQTFGTFCTDAAAALWDAGRLTDARSALQQACRQGQDPQGCASLAQLQDRPLDAVAATVLPCGSYLASQGLMEHLPFGDGGLVDSGFGGKLRARLQDGQIRIRHDKGDDFVFQPLRNGDLVGIDGWNRYAYYQHQPDAGPAQCKAPVVFVETPLPQDCPTLAREGGAEACCAAGKLQGCNAAGHQQALRGQWSQAAPFYLKLCDAGVREGCENLATVYAHTGDDALPQAIAARCERDGSGTHVACDVHATRNWPLLQLGAEMEQLAERMAAEPEHDGDRQEADEPTGSEEEPAPAAPRNRKRR